MKGPEIIGRPQCAKQVMASTGLLTLDGARQVLIALSKAGYMVAPLEPTNAMFDAYISALGRPATKRETIIANIGKARRRWKAMASMGMKVAFSDQALVDQPDGHLNSTQAHAGSSPAECATNR